MRIGLPPLLGSIINFVEVILFFFPFNVKARLLNNGILKRFEQLQLLFREFGSGVVVGPLILLLIIIVAVAVPHLQFIFAVSCSFRIFFIRHFRS